jgi:hypothetical protein
MQVSIVQGTCEFSQPITNAVIRVCDNASNVIEAHEHNGDFKDW